MALGSGGPEAKAAADDVTDDVNKDGLYNAFVHLGLIYAQQARIPLPVPASAGMDRGILHEGEKVKKKISEMVSHKRQDTTATVIPCLYLLLFTVLRTLAVGLPVNKKRTRILSHRESGSGTNCMVEN